ncbi:IS66-like element accessory protein TnpA [Rhizobium sullae]|uniref:Transposase n=1 Tax=Rhizobium sullae TaxID=50338 RepID=A0A4R3PQZ9_RHISU|nr:transposase [Rhizobium sullae]TCU03565.1 transposase [Rhizobium sullae]UWU19104.1 transposase [Rhizobium sullae]
MVGDRADAMLEVMDEGMHEARHEGKYRRIEVITGRRQRRNWTDEEKARILAESAEPEVNISALARRWGVNRGLLNVWRREAGLTSRRSAKACAHQAVFVPVTVVGDRTDYQGSPSDVAHVAAGRIEIEIAGARLTVIGSVAPELAQAVVAALRGRR